MRGWLGIANGELVPRGQVELFALRLGEASAILQHYTGAALILIIGGLMAGLLLGALIGKRLTSR